MEVLNHPHTVRVAISSKCNLSCTYCSFRNSPAERENDLPADSWLPFFSTLKNMDIAHLELSGGEPFLRNDIELLIDHLDTIGLPFSIYTNATQVTEELASYLAGKPFLRNVRTSLDGPSATVHGTSRGDASFDQVVAGIQWLRGQEIDVSVQVTLHKGNVSHISEVTEFLIETLRVPTVFFNAALYLGKCCNYASDIQLSIPQYTDAMRKLVALKDRYPSNIGASSGPLADAFYWTHLHMGSKGRMEIPWEGGHLTGCSCVFNDISVLSDGTIVPCHLLGSITLGNIATDNILDIWTKHEKLRFLRARRKISLNSFFFCKDCNFKNFCTGNCPALALNEFGIVNHPSKTGCLRDFLRDGGVLPDLP